MGVEIDGVGVRELDNYFPPKESRVWNVVEFSREAKKKIDRKKVSLKTMAF